MHQPLHILHGRPWGPMSLGCYRRGSSSCKQLEVSWGGGVPKMDGFQWKILLKWMIWGYPHFRKPPSESCSFGGLGLIHWRRPSPMTTPGATRGLLESVPICPCFPSSALRVPLYPLRLPSLYRSLRPTQRANKITTSACAFARLRAAKVVEFQWVPHVSKSLHPEKEKEWDPSPMLVSVQTPRLCPVGTA